MRRCCFEKNASKSTCESPSNEFLIDYCERLPPLSLQKIAFRLIRNLFMSFNKRMTLLYSKTHRICATFRSYFVTTFSSCISLQRDALAVKKRQKDLGLPPCNSNLCVYLLVSSCLTNSVRQTQIICVKNSHGQKRVEKHRNMPVRPLSNCH